MATAWIITTYFKTALYFYAFVLGTAQIFKLKKPPPSNLPCRVPDLRTLTAHLQGHHLLCQRNSPILGGLESNSFARTSPAYSRSIQSEAARRCLPS
ncbi:hypothetical protein ACFSQ7_22470 [Paenibacillus rhizoplanae]